MSLTAARSAAIADWMQIQRWYGDKSRVLDSPSFTLLGTVDCGEVRVDLVTVDCLFRDGGQSSYFIPLVSDDSQGESVSSIVDALQIPAFLNWLGSGFPEVRVLEGGDWTIRWIPGHGADSLAGVVGNGRLLRSEQSNSSIMFGDRAIAKVFRRLQPGLNPDVEIIKYLTEQTEYRHVPRHMGTLVIESTPPSESATLAAVQGFVDNQGDGWTWLLRELEIRSDIERIDLLEAIEILGTRTAELHIALALPTADPAFSTTLIEEQDTVGLVQRLVKELDGTLASLLISEVRSGEALQEVRKGVGNKIGRLHQLVGFPMTRVHGDYHLGQVLRTSTDFVIIDFEGEPSRSMVQRRQKMSPLKDVAGMLRSLDYAIATWDRTTGDSGSTAIREWGRQAVTAFVRGYLTSVWASGARIVPAERQDFDVALEFFMIEKALYEIRYELDNRPEWLEIPLRVLETIAHRA